MQVLDLVHPSLYCYVAGVTKVTEEEARPAVKFMGSGEARNNSSKKNKKKKGGQSYTVSKKFQWLPSEFAVDEDGHVTINSYINNLHPVWHKELYPVIARIFERFVPLFNKVLTDLYNPRPHRVECDTDWYAEEEDDFQCSLDEDDPQYDDRYQSWRESREPQQPRAPEFVAPDPPTRMVDLRGRNLQVIVKLANIELTPEKPKYPGGVWHVEGMENEHIVASGIYYYVSENITESKLAFRQAVCEPDYEQDDRKGVTAIYGLRDEASLNQQLGAVITKEDRCIAFPNVLQHKVAPFRLKDKSKPGHRKILVFFLVDPALRVLSTASVPPQQRSWMLDIVQRDMSSLQLPPEITAKVMDHVAWPMSLADAKRYREELMKERKYFISKNNEEFFERPFSMCEH